MIAAGTFRLKKLGPDRNCVRRKLIQMIVPPNGAFLEKTGHSDESATPRYNNTVVADALTKHHLRLISETANAVGPEFHEAVLMLKTWLRQRGMGGDMFGTMNGYTATMLLCHLIHSKVVFRESSSYQMFRAVMTHIATNDWEVNGLRMQYRQLVSFFFKIVNAFVVVQGGNDVLTGQGCVYFRARSFLQKLRFQALLFFRRHSM